MLACQNNGYQYPFLSITNRKAIAPEVKYTTPTFRNQTSSLKQFKTKKAFTCRILR
jgi:hypothetical protein